MQRSAVAALAALCFFAAGCGDSSSGSYWSSCQYDEWCDARGCHQREACEFESCSETWDDDFGEEEYVEECRRGVRTTEETASHDGSFHLRRITEAGQSCVWVQRASPYDYEEYGSCHDYYEEEFWRTQCDAFGCVTEHCVDGHCYAS